MSGGSCVSGRNDSGTYDSGTKVAPPIGYFAKYYKIAKKRTPNMTELQNRQKYNSEII
jgi:hypothetical protein